MSHVALLLCICGVKNMLQFFFLNFIFSLNDFLLLCALLFLIFRSSPSCYMSHDSSVHLPWCLLRRCYTLKIHFSNFSMWIHGKSRNTNERRDFEKLLRLKFLFFSTENFPFTGCQCCIVAHIDLGCWCNRVEQSRRSRWRRRGWGGGGRGSREGKKFEIFFSSLSSICLREDACPRRWMKCCSTNSVVWMWEKKCERLQVTTFAISEKQQAREDSRGGGECENKRNEEIGWNVHTRCIREKNI